MRLVEAAEKSSETGAWISDYCRFFLKTFPPEKNILILVCFYFCGQDSHWIDQWLMEEIT